MKRLLILCGVLSLGVSCGLVDDRLAEEERLSRVRFADAAFERICLAAGDTDGDGVLSRYEARAVRSLDCRGAGIGSMQGIEAFSGLVSLDCGDNPVARLDLSACSRLERLACDGCALDRLDLSSLARLREVRCGGNVLTGIDLADNHSLEVLDCHDNCLENIAVEECSLSMRLLWTRGNPELTYIYLAEGQRIDDLRVDDATRVVYP